MPEQKKIKIFSDRIRQFRWYSLLLFLLVIITGAVGTYITAYSVSLNTRQSLIRRSETIASTLSASEVKQLKGNSTDLDNPTYRTIKNRLRDIRQSNSDVRFVYLMGRVHGKVYFLVDSEDPNSRDYSPPGQTYEEASPALHASFINRQSFVEGPSSDQWGSWVSAFSPIIDPADDRLIAMVGIDANASTYYRQIITSSLIPVSITIIGLFALYYERRIHAKEKEILSLKTKFISIASHELRSPLTGMLWAIQSLLSTKNSNLNDKQQSLLTDMYHSAESSIATINEILDMTIFERKHANTDNFVQTNVQDVLKEVINNLQLGAHEKSIKLKFEDDWPEAAYVNTDPNALKRAFMNIVSNSIKYSHEHGTITFGYERQGSNHVIKVTDNGIGIPKQDIKKVLEGYYRAGNAIKIKSDGTGLGLYVTRLIIEQHDGKLWLESLENHGTTAFVSLPAYDVTMNQDRSS